MRREASEYGIPIIQIRRYNTSNLCPSLFRTMSKDDTFLTLLNLYFLFREMFRKRNVNTALAALTVSCVYVCRQIRMFTYSGNLFCIETKSVATNPYSLRKYFPNKSLHSGSRKETTNIVYPTNLQLHFSQNITLQYSSMSSFLSYF